MRYEQQQFRALMAERGVLALSREQAGELAARIRPALDV
jgi:hypothetical protein